MDWQEAHKYLGTRFTKIPEILEEIKNRIIAVNRWVYSLNTLLRSKKMSPEEQK